jgi:microsomal dipeptidase-like Zn-dependent dipeptidase
MTDDERDDVMAALGTRYVAAEKAGDETVKREILGGDWDGVTGAPAAWAVYLVGLLDAVVHMIPDEAVDWVVVADAENGDIPLSMLDVAGKRAVVERLARRGLSDRKIAARLDGISMDAVCQFRKRHNIPAGVPASRSTQAEEGAA